MAVLLLHKLRKLAWHAGFPLCSMGTGNMLSEPALHKTCIFCAATELMEGRRKKRRQHKEMNK